jgi:DNA/RNA endonuclease YhcR with UshA esterase domain
VKQTISIATVVALLFSVPAAAHHNFAAHYQMDELVEVSGVVSEFRFVNPHVRVYFEVTNEDGTAETWMAEGDASVALRRSGWTEDQFKPGDQIEVTGHPSRRGANMLGWQNVAIVGSDAIGGGDGRLEERLRILEESLAEYRRERGP